MRLETIPLVLGGLTGLIGLGLLLDAWLKDDVFSGERRKRPRRERSRFGEGLVGLGVLAMAAAFVARDGWRYSTVVVIAGAVLLLWGTKLNVSYLRAAFSGGRGRVPAPEEPAPTPTGQRRIR